MNKGMMAGVCALALLGNSVAFAAKVKARSCASPTEVTAIQAQVVQQQLMVAALSCQQIANFNTFQTTFRPEIMAADSNLMKMFKRTGKGVAAYHLFKTELANKMQIRFIHDTRGYCSAVEPMFAAALAQNKPALRDFVSGVQVLAEDTPLQSCQLQVAVNLAGAQSAVIVPKPNPRWVPDPNAPPLDAAPAPAAASATPVR